MMKVNLDLMKWFATDITIGSGSNFLIHIIINLYLEIK